MGEGEPLSKRLKSDDAITDEAAPDPAPRPPASSGLTNYMGNFALSWGEDGDEWQPAGAAQSKAGWTEMEDRMVLAAVRTFGTQWGAVSGKLVGRTADAVRNRWHRLQKRGLSDPSEETVPCRQLLAAAAMAGDRPVIWPDPKPDPQIHSELHSGAAAPSTSAAEGTGLPGTDVPAALLSQSSEVLCLTGSDHGRARWTSHEDQVIQEGVNRWGCKWRQIAAMLPGRSDSSIRNRWMRLLKSTSGGDDAPTQPADHQDSRGNERTLPAAPPGADSDRREDDSTVEPDTALILVAFAQSR